MKNRNEGSNQKRSSDLMANRNKFKKNMNRMGGRGGLSLEAFANAKTRNPNYNPALIKKQQEFYRNAKFVQKYKRSLNQKTRLDAPSTSKIPLEGENEANDSHTLNTISKNTKHGWSLNELYEKKKAEEEIAQAEREAVIQAKNEARQEAEAKRRNLKQKMLKKTRFGQPVMKYRIEHFLETLQNETS